MLMNNLDPEVAERPDELVVYGGIGRAARDWECFDAIVARCARSSDDETLLVQSGKPVGVFRTHADAPRVLIANSNLVPQWATWEQFQRARSQGPDDVRPDDRRLWIYIGTQGIVQGTYETFAEIGRASTSAATSPAAGSSPRASAAWAARSRSPRRWPAPRCSPSRSPERASRCGSHALPRRAAPTLDEALRDHRARARAEAAVSVGLLGNAAEMLPELVRARRAARRRHRPDSRARPAQRLPPAGWTLAEWHELRERDPESTSRARARALDGRARRGDARASGAGVPTFDYGNNIRQEAKDAGRRRRLRLPRLRPGLHPAAVLPRHRAVPLGALSGDPEDIYAHRRAR
jgi:urocanate hydratase